MSWQPIETAPKDGTSVLLWGDNRLWEIDETDEFCPECIIGYWQKLSDQWRADGEGWVWNPTHWMPLPGPPA